MDETSNGKASQLHFFFISLLHKIERSHKMLYYFLVSEDCKFNEGTDEGSK